MLTPSHEVAVFADVDQFQPGQSQDMCGYYAAASFVQSVAPGQLITVTHAQVLAQARAEYEKYAGPDVPSNTNGMSQTTLHKVLADHGLNGFDLPANLSASAIIPLVVQAGYPVFVCVTESSVFDMNPNINGNPYPWNTGGLDHIMLVTGLSGSDYLCRDSANIEAPNTLRAGPRIYSAARLQVLWATVGLSGWLPSWPPPTPPAPTPAPALSIVRMLVPDAYVFKGSAGYTRRFLVLHKTGGGSTAQGTAQYFIDGADGAHTSVHYVVGLDGVIVQCVDEADGAGGNCCLELGHDAFWPTDVNLNLITFSIESVDPSLTNATAMPHAQKDALFPLVKDVCTRNSIPMRPADATGGIAGHASIAPKTRGQCPGTFAWDELWSYLQGEAMAFIPITLADPLVANYFADAGGGQWRCKQNNFVLLGGILDFYRSFGGNALAGLTHLGLPMSNELARYPKYPEVKEQQFEHALVRYDPNHVIDKPVESGAVYLAHLDTPSTGDVALRAAITAVQAIVSKFQ